MAAAADLDSIPSGRKVISTLFPYTIHLEQNGDKSMATAILLVWTSDPLKFVWDRIGPHIVRLFGKSNHPSLHYAIPLALPKIRWDDGLRDGNKVIGWDAAASTDPSTEKAGQVVNLLLQIAYVDPLLPHIPIDIWAWLKKRPSLPPMCQGRLRGTKSVIVRHVRRLGDIEILTSYLLVVWSEWDPLYPCGIDEMEIAIREDFGGRGMARYRKELIGRLDRILGKLEGFEKNNPQKHQSHVQRRKEQYGKLKEVLQEVDGEQ
jgi:hypothetical protein